MTIRHVKLTYVDTGESVLADLLDSEAPRTCASVWDRLPVEHKMIHGMYSGAEVFMYSKSRLRSRRTLFNYPSRVSCFISTTKGRTRWGVSLQPKSASSTGRGVVLRAHEGIPTQASLFARIPGDWKSDWVSFAQACRRCRWEGPQRLRIERA